MIIGTQGWRAGAHVPINCLALDDFSLTSIQAATSAVWYSVPNRIIEKRNSKLRRF